MRQLGDLQINEALRVKDDVVYHYTAFSVLPVFFRDGADLYCTNSKCLNDPTEMTLGAYGFADYLHAMGRLPDDRHKHLCKNIEETIQQDWFDAWVMSFTTLGDDLSQWRGYTSNVDGGYAIGFDVPKLLDALKVLTPKLPISDMINSIPLMTRCWYSEANWNLIHNLYEQKYKEFKTDFDAYATTTPLTNEIIRSVVSTVFAFSMHIKHGAFKAEKEVRIIINVPGCNYSEVQILGGKPRLPLGLPKLEQPLHSYIKVIRISPHGQRDRLRAQVEWLKRKCCGNFDIVESEIPYDPSR